MAGHTATLTLEEGDAGSDVRIVTRWPIGVDPETLSATPDAARALTS